MSLTEAKARIKDIPISMVVGRYISLNKKGSHYSGLCPFHSDTHPSLTVNDQKGLFKCFACNSGGDSIAFVQKYKTLDFRDTLIEIFQLFNWPTEELTGPSAGQKDPKRVAGLELTLKATQIYRQAALSGKHPEYQKFLESRGLDERTAETFQLGIAPGQHDFIQYLKNLPPKEMKDAFDLSLELGLVRKGPANRTGNAPPFETFRERIIFPVWDIFGQVVGFSSRALQSYQKAKYLNSQESFLFNKKNVLFGFHLAKGKIRERNQIILVEGHMDLIALHKFGFEHSVAIMGVALSEKSILNLKALSKNFVLALDTDTAGFNAMKRINADLMAHGILARTISFSPQKDPDEFLKAQGAASLAQKLDEAPLFIDEIVENLLQSLFTLPNPPTIDAKLEVLQKIFEEMSPLGDSLMATEKVASFAKRLELSSRPSQIIESYRNFCHDHKKRPSSAVPSHPLPDLALTLQAPVPPPPPPAMLKITKIHRSLITEIIYHPDILGHPQLTKLLEFLDHNDVQRLVQYLKRVYFEIDESEFPSVILDGLLKENFSTEMRDIVGSALFHHEKRPLNEKVLDKLVLDLLNNVVKEVLMTKREDLRQKQKDCGDPDKLEEIIRELNQIERQVHGIKSRNIKHYA